MNPSTPASARPTFVSVRFLVIFSLLLTCLPFTHAVDSPTAKRETPDPVVQKAKASKQSKVVGFSGHQWRVKASNGRVGPGNNYFSDTLENVEVDVEGRLHLRITERSNQWQSAEIILKKNLGYGTYRFFLETPAERLDRNIVLGLFTWSDNPESNHREIDVEISAWGKSGEDKLGQFCVQPYRLAGHLKRFVIPENLVKTTHSFTWSSNQVSFLSAKGHTSSPTKEEVIFQWIFAKKGVPPEGSETPRINLWLFGSRPPTDANDTEAIISKFEFEPLPRDNEQIAPNAK